MLRLKPIYHKKIQAYIVKTYTHKGEFIFSKIISQLDHTSAELFEAYSKKTIRNHYKKHKKGTCNIENITHYVNYKDHTIPVDKTLISGEGKEELYRLSLKE